MTKLLRSLLREDYLVDVKTAMLKKHWNNTTLSHHTEYSKAHIGNLLAGNGSDDALAATCVVLGIDIRSLMKGIRIDNDSAAERQDSNQADADGVVQPALGSVSGSPS